MQVVKRAAPDVSAPAVRLSAALADRYRIERGLGQGGMATELVTEVTARRMSLKRPSPSVTPAKAGVQSTWIPATLPRRKPGAGMTIMSWNGTRND